MRVSRPVSILIFLLVILCALSCARGQSVRPFDIGQPQLVDLWLDGVKGNDANNGLSKEQAFKTVRAAWMKTLELSRIPGDRGYQINVLPGLVRCGNYCGNTFQGRAGTHRTPTILRGVGPEPAIIEGGLDVYASNTSYLYLINLTFVAGGAFGLTSNNVLHFASVDNLLLRNVRAIGANPGIQEVLKVNQCQRVFVEDCEFSQATQSGLDFMASRFGHIIGSRFHDLGTEGILIKGGSAYFRVERNKIYKAKFGATIGQSAGFQFMQAPWLNYDALDIKFTSNVIENVEGAGVTVFGGYNVLIAHNTMRNVAYSPTGFGFVTLGYSTRICSGTVEECTAQRARGGWGPVLTGAENAIAISNKGVYVYNNIFRNDTDKATRYGHFTVYGSRGSLRADDDVRFGGNVVWNGSKTQPLGIEHESWGCQPSNPTCNPTMIRDYNLINVIDPFPSLDGYLAGFGVPSFAPAQIPPFVWDLAGVPEGELSNQLSIAQSGIALRSARKITSGGR